MKSHCLALLSPTHSAADTDARQECRLLKLLELWEWFNFGDSENTELTPLEVWCQFAVSNGLS